MPICQSKLPKRRERMMALYDFCHHMAKLPSPMRPQRAVNSRIKPATVSDIKIGNQLLVYCDEPNAWYGPFRVVDINNKDMYVHNDGFLVQHFLDRCKRYRLEDKILEMMK